MTVYIEKPAVNLREELASLRNQGGYQEQQFYFDGLVENGGFDAGTSGWTAFSAATSISAAGGVLVQELVSGAASTAYTSFSTEVGKTYSVQVEVTALTGGATNPKFYIGPSLGSGTLLQVSGTTVETLSGTFVATTTTTYLHTEGRGSLASTVSFDNVSVFEVDANDDVIHTIPKGWKPKDFYEDGLLQREGVAHDYEVVYDGFDYYVKPTVAPSATTQTCVIGVKA